MASPAVTVNGTFQDPSGTGQPGAVVVFTLMGWSNANPPIVSGTSSFAPLTYAVTAGAGGVWSAIIFGNDQITIGGATSTGYYQVQIFPPGSSLPVSTTPYLITTGTYRLDQLTPLITIPVPVGPIPTNILTGNNSFTGNNTFSGTVTLGSSVSLTGPLSITGAYNLNKTIYVDGVQYANIAAALAAVPANGGKVVCPSGYRETLTSQVTIGSSTQPVHLHLERDVILTCNITNGTSYGFQINNGSKLTGDAIGALGSLAGGSVIKVPSTGNMAALITNNYAGTQEYWEVSDLFLSIDPAATWANAVIDIPSVFVPSYMRNVSCQDFTGIGLWIHDSQNSAGGSNVFIIDNCWINGSYNVGARPVVIQNSLAGASGSVSEITFLGGAIEHPGAGNYAVEINGGGAYAFQVTNINFFGTQVETNTSATVSQVFIKDARMVTWIGGAIGAGTGQAAIEISQTSANQTHGILFWNCKGVGGVKNDINSTTTVDSTTGIINYYYGTATYGMPTWHSPAQFGPMTFNNVSDSAMTITLQPGVTADQDTWVSCYGHTGTLRGKFGVTGSATEIWGNTTFPAFEAFAGSHTYINAQGSGAGAAVLIGFGTNAGQGGVQVWSGGASPANTFTLPGTGGITRYNGVVTAGQGVPPIINTVVATAQTANYNAGSAKTLLTPTVAATLYRITAAEFPVVAATGATLPSLTVGWTDSASIARTNVLIASTSTSANSTYVQGTLLIETDGATAVTVTSASYAAGSGTALSYDLCVTVEQLV